MGNRMLFINEAVKLIPINCKICSPVYETEALLPSGAPAAWNKNFLNAAITGYISPYASPYIMLKYIKSLEAKLGRNRGPRWAPRTIDIDIICWGKMIIQGPTLSIPHPAAISRDFVLKPICHIAPHFKHPIKKQTINEIYQKLCINNTNQNINFATHRLYS